MGNFDLVRLNPLAAMSAAVAAVVLSAAAVPAHATVTYKFAADSALNGYPYGAFEFTTASFLTGTNAIAVGALTSCTISYSASASTVCGEQFISELFTPTYDTIGFGSKDVGSAQPWDVQVYYYFAKGSFGAAGTYETVIFGGDQHATLTISEAAGVPEPGAWALMICGFGLVGAVMRRRPVAAA